MTYSQSFPLADEVQSLFARSLALVLLEVDILNQIMVSYYNVWSNSMYLMRTLSENRQRFK